MATPWLPRWGSATLSRIRKACRNGGMRGGDLPSGDDMQLIFPAGLIFIVVLWGILSPASMAAVIDTALASTIRNFGWLYL